MVGLMLQITKTVNIPLAEVEITAIRSPGPGGQNVNKVATAIHLRFDIRASSLPDLFKERLLVLADHRITKDGVVVIKAARARSQEKNREDALRRLQELLKSVSSTPKKKESDQAEPGFPIDQDGQQDKKGQGQESAGQGQKS